MKTHLMDLKIIYDMMLKDCIQIRKRIWYDLQEVGKFFKNKNLWESTRNANQFH